MKKIFVILLLALNCIDIYAQQFDDLWSEKTCDAAYEAPNSLLYKTWIGKSDPESTMEMTFKRDGTFKQIIHLQQWVDTGVILKYSINMQGTWKRNRDVLVLFTNNSKFSYFVSQDELSKLSLRKKDKFNESMNNVVKNMRKEGVTKDTYVLLRLDDSYLLYYQKDNTSNKYLLKSE